MAGLMLPPNTIPRKENTEETISLVQPGRQVYELPPELPGSLTIIGNSLAKGSFAAVYKGQWSSGGETKTVAIKRVALPGANIGHEQFRTLSDAARGLLHLHKLNPQIVHGDIKPENVIVQDDLVAALCDFGISKIHVEQHTGLTTSGVTGGTSGYQAKELLNEDPATPATDVYAFGGLILAAMSGKQPFHNKRPNATIIAVFNDKTPEPRDHPGLPATDPLWKLLYACWSGQPDKRPPMSAVLEM
ncbi:hypothetical protein FS837_010956, partial [Tulasnella sp. UAMH 9824]